jgi:hypothetical protein
MPPASRHRPALALAALGFALALALPSGPAGAARARLTCARPTRPLVKADLGLVVKAPTASRQGPVLVCQYASAGAPQALLVRYETGVTHRSFVFGRSQFDQHAEPTAALAGLGTEAYTSRFTAGPLTETTVVARQGGLEVLVTSAAPQAGEVKLVRTLLRPSA